MLKTTPKKQRKVREECSEKEVLDKLTFAFAQEVEQETCESHLDVLEQIADTAESLAKRRR